MEVAVELLTVRVWRRSSVHKKFNQLETSIFVHLIFKQVEEGRKKMKEEELSFLGVGQWSKREKQ